MRALKVLVSLCLAVGAACSQGSYRRLGPRDRPFKEDLRRSTGATNKYILETRPGIAPGHVAKQAGGGTLGHDDNTTYHREFDCSDIFSGLVIETRTQNADTLRDLDGVVNVWPMSSVPLAPIPDDGAPDLTTPSASNYSIHRWTGVDKLHAQGIRGQGATIAVIDTGIDYNHIALGGCFGPGCKISGGYDLVGPNWNTHQEASLPKLPDDDPLDTYGHGTHVAGIIGADIDSFQGVAPDANILIYKVFSDNPEDTDEEVLIQSFCDAYSAGADVITASIGRPNGFTDNPWALVASRLVEKGIVVVISAGNEGYTGPVYSNSGSNGDGVISVAAVNASTSPNITARPIAAYFTSWGPTNELLLKPEIGAPGYRVLSTWPEQAYKELSGTSMAAPYIAGVAALWISEHGGRAMHGPGLAKTLAAKIAASGQSVAWSGDRVTLNRTSPPFQVGTGIVDAWKVLHSDTQVDAEPFALQDTESFVPHWSAKITNNGNATVTYRFELEPQVGVEMLDTYYGIQTLFDLVPQTIVPGVTLPGPVKILPGGSSTVEFDFELPNISDDMLPLYGGKVLVIGDNGERLSIPYGGVAYDTEKEFDTMFTREPYVNEYKNDWAWTFNMDNAPYDFVELTARLRYPCFHLRWDIFAKYWDERNWELPTKPGENGYIGSATTFRDADTFWYFDPVRMDKEDTVPFPLMRVPRGFANYWWFGKLANGTYIAPGNYTMRFAALRPYGNPNISDHWDAMGIEPIRFEVLPSNGTNNSTRPTKHHIF